jgi:hypothetical protein
MTTFLRIARLSLPLHYRSPFGPKIIRVVSLIMLGNFS